MKTRTLKKNKVNVITLGCSKNIFDSEVMMAQLKANRFDVVHESQDLDSEIVIINTCGFIESAKEESINAIIEYAEAKKTGDLDKLYVAIASNRRTWAMRRSRACWDRSESSLRRDASTSAAAVIAVMGERSSWLTSEAKRSSRSRRD